MPQYLVAGIFAGGGVAGWRASEEHWSWSFGSGGLIGLLVIVAVVVLLFRGAYPQSIFDLVLGLNRWVIRVGAYATLLTREYPPFRLDVGEDDPGGLTLGGPEPAAGEGATAVRSQRWGPGRVLGVVLGSLAVLVGVALLAAGGVAVAFDQTQRDADGYLSANATAYSTGTYAFVSDSYRTGAVGDWFVARDLLGTVRIRSESSSPVFVGIGPAGAVESYLAGSGARGRQLRCAPFPLPPARGKRPGGRSDRRGLLGRRDGRHRHARADLVAAERRLEGGADERRRLLRRHGGAHRRCTASRTCSESGSACSPAVRCCSSSGAWQCTPPSPAGPNRRPGGCRGSRRPGRPPP